MPIKRIRHKLYIHRDKIMHFAVLSFVSFLTGRAYGILVAVGFGAMLSIAKEAYDTILQGECIDVGDLAADALGILFGLLLLVL